MSTPGTQHFNIQCNKIHIKYLYCLLKYDCWGRKSICGIVLSSRWTSHFFHRTLFLLKRMTSKLSLFKLGYMADTFLKMNISWNVTLRQTVFVVNSNIQAFEWKWELDSWKNVVFATVFLTASPNLKDFSGKTGENINAFWGTL